MKRSVKIVPAILTDDPHALEKMVRQTETFTDYVQIDFMDGAFVPSRSVSWREIARVRPAIDWEAHLMVQNPQDYLPGFREAGAKEIFFHYEATSQPLKIVEKVQKLGLRAGIAVNPETPVSAIMPFARAIDSVLFMSVHPGYYGSRFLPEVLDKVKEFRRLQPGKKVGIDGGVKEDNLLQVAQSGVDFICVGSAIFLQPDPAASFRRLQSLVSEGRE